MNGNLIFAIVNDDMKVARHLSKGRMAVFTDIKKLKKYAWRYMSPAKKYKIVELGIAVVVAEIGKEELR